MGYLTEIDPLRSHIAFPQPDESSSFHPSSGRAAIPPAGEVSGWRQDEFWLEKGQPAVRMNWVVSAMECLEELRNHSTQSPRWIGERVEQLLAARKQLAASHTEADKTYFARKCASLDRQIDELVYELYGLTEAEIKIVEAGKN